jgi:hypothetical protein
MKSINRIVFLFWFFAFFIFFGGIYSRFNLSYNAMLAITIVLSVILAAGMVIEFFVPGRD